MSSEAEPLRLHLGCGERYLEGYTNIDFPPESQSVLDTSAADVHADLTELVYPANSVGEIRLHHVFEHFDRPTALRLLVDWHEWLGDEGALTIETPDFERCARQFVLPWRRGRREVLLRHIFGSHEAAWAVHWDGWYEQKFRHYLTSLGYSNLEFRKNSWRGTYNITVSAQKGRPDRTREELEQAADALLRESMVDQSDSEQRMARVWSDALRRR